jgi:hypothetical protein
MIKKEWHFMQTPKDMKNFRDELRLITNNTEWTDNEKFEAIDEMHERYVAKKETESKLF